MAEKGYFIVLEGGEGTGKTTQAKRLVGAFEAKGRQAIYTKEPGGTGVADKIRSVLLYSDNEKVDPRCELFLFLASRSQHVAQKIKPAIADGRTIICDRFSGSTFAYQVAGRGIAHVDRIKEMDAFARYEFTPDLIIYLDIDPKIGLGRKETQLHDEMTRFDAEELAFHTKVRDAFLTLAKNDPTWEIVSANGTIEEIGQALKEVVSKRLNIEL